MESGWNCGEVRLGSEADVREGDRRSALKALGGSLAGLQGDLDPRGDGGSIARNPPASLEIAVMCHR
jgi:hypothetical protein